MSPLAAPTTYVPSLRGDAMLLTHGRAGSERLIAAALLLDAIRGGQLDAIEGRRVVAGPEQADAPPLLADLRGRVLDGPPDSPRGWIERAAVFANHRIAAELVAAGLASPLARRFQRDFTLSVDVRAERAARERILGDPALAGLLYSCGLPTGDPLPPAIHTLEPAARSILAALREASAAETRAARLAS